MPPADKTYTVADLTKRLLVTEATVLAWIASGELKAINVGRSARAKKPRWRITQAALDAFELARTPAPPTTHVRRLKRPAAGVVEFYKT